MIPLMKAPDVAATISDELKAHLEGGMSVLVGTRDLGLAPEMVRAWGTRVAEDRQSVILCVPLATCRKTLDNLASNGQIAISFGLPTNMRAVQLKGTCIGTGEPDEADLAAVERHREAFAATNEQIGVPRKWIETFWQREVESSPAMVKLCFVPEHVFDQTPGPNAGSPL